MTLSTIEPTSALVIVDLLNGTLAQPLAHPADDIVERSVALAAAFRAKGLPVVLAAVDGLAPGRTDVSPAGGGRSFPAEWAAVDARLAGLGDHSVTRARWGSFSGTDLEEYLRSKGVTQVVITGLVTSIGVESTARGAYDRGFNVVIPTDAVTDRNPEAHDSSVARVFPLLAETTTTAEVLAALA